MADQNAVQIPIELLTDDALVSLRNLGKALDEMTRKFSVGTKETVTFGGAMEALKKSVQGPAGLAASVIGIGSGVANMMLNFAAGRQQLQLMADTARVSTREFTAMQDTFRVAGASMQEATGYASSFTGALKDMWMNRWGSRAGQEAMRYGDVAVRSIGRVMEAVKGGNIAQGIGQVLNELRNTAPQYRDKMFEFYSQVLGIPAPLLEEQLENYRKHLDALTGENLETAKKLSRQWTNFQIFMEHEVWDKIALNALEKLNEMVEGFDTEQGKANARSFVDAVNQEINKIDTKEIGKEIREIVDVLKEADNILNSFLEASQAAGKVVGEATGIAPKTQQLLQQHQEEMKKPWEERAINKRLREQRQQEQEQQEQERLPETATPEAMGGAEGRGLFERLGIPAPEPGQQIQLKEEQSKNTTALSDVSEQLKELNTYLDEQLHGSRAGAAGGTQVASLDTTAGVGGAIVGAVRAAGGGGIAAGYGGGVTRGLGGIPPMGGAGPGAETGAGYGGPPGAAPGAIPGVGAPGAAPGAIPGVRGVPGASGEYGDGGKAAAGDGSVPSDLLDQAKQAALTGGPGAVERFMRAHGHPKAGNWCGEFAAAVVDAAGGTPPKNPAIASNWRNWGASVEGMPQPGDIAVRRGVPTGSTGSHVTFVEGVDPKTGRFTGLGGNQGRPEASYPLSGYTFRRAMPRDVAGIAGGGMAGGSGATGEEFSGLGGTAGGGGATGGFGIPMPKAAPSMGAGETGGGTGPRSDISGGGLAGARAGFARELQNDPALHERLFRLAQAENPQNPQAFMESVMNRAAARGQTLSAAANDKSYYPRVSQIGQTPRDRPGMESALQGVLGGSNITGFATGNASLNVGFGYGRGARDPFTYRDPRTGERYGVENRPSDISFAKRMGEEEQAGKARVDIGPVRERGGGESSPFDEGAAPLTGVDFSERMDKALGRANGGANGKIAAEVSFINTPPNVRTRANTTGEVFENLKVNNTKQSPKADASTADHYPWAQSN